jgi:hypothetical protein
MGNLEDALDRIKKIECPTGDLGKWIAGIVEDYNIGPKNEVKVMRVNDLDRNGAKGYKVEVAGQRENSMVVMATFGMDDYVMKVVDAYIE